MRTNEQEFGQGWQLREFNLQSTGLLDLATVKQTPDSGLEGSTIVHDYLRDNQVDIVNDRYVVPLHYPGSDPFLAGAAGTGLSTFFWSAPNLNTITNPFETRREFSLGTCSGCHTGETNTLFTHIGDEGKREMGMAARLSPFLLGEDVVVPMGGGSHHYEDLTERKIAMSNLLGRSCIHLLSFQRLPFVH